MSETRKLAAILVSDVVGYSRLTGADEDRILARLRTLRSDLIDPTIAVHHGRIVKRTGDGSIIEFRSVVDAVHCAIEVQNGMVERNAGLPPESRIEFRDRHPSWRRRRGKRWRSYGRRRQHRSAARRDLRAGRSVLVRRRLSTSQVAARTSSYRPWATDLKNIAEPVRAYLLRQRRACDAKTAPLATRTRGVWARWPALAAALALVFSPRGHTLGVRATRRVSWPLPLTNKLTNAPRLSIVVLPFENLGGDPEQQYFADGITDDLTTDLSHVPDSFVIARDTAFTFKGRQVDAKAIGRELGVRYMLEGSVRRAGEKVEINAQLISTETGAHVWADQFEGERSNLGKLQFEVVARLANSLGWELMKAEVLRDERERPGDPDARDLTMRGFATIWNFNGANKATWNDAIAMFERALALDPHNARAMTGLATALLVRPYAGWSDDPAADVARAEKTAEDALALRPDDSDAHMVKSYLFETKSQTRAALAEAETAVGDDPNNARAIAQAGYLGSYFGHSEDGVAAVETALRLSPHDPTAPIMQVHLCYLHNNLAQWEQAIEWCEKALANNVKERGNALAALAVANAWAGHDKEAKDAVAELRKVDPAFTVKTMAGWHPSDDPTFKAQFARYLEGLRKAGVPEGTAKTN